MAWITGQQFRKPVEDINKTLLAIPGDIEDDEEARILAAKFLRYNIGIAVELLTGIKLEPFQEIILRGWFNSNFNMFVATRGSGKSFLIAVYCILKCIFEPETKILLASSNFRTSRLIFQEIERIVDRPQAILLQQCFTKKPSKKNDLFEWSINDGSIRAIPLSGERVRGFRAYILVVDEFLLVPQSIIEDVLIPFLASPQNLEEMIRVREQENEMIRKGVMDESEKRVFPNTAQLFALSSASYTFEYLYKLYEKWMYNIKNYDQYIAEAKKKADENKEEFVHSSFFIAQLGYEALPKHMIAPEALQIAKDGGANSPAFLREWCARFVDGGNGYFSPEKMKACTIEDGDFPTIKLRGDKDKKYILSIDPNQNEAKNSDFFAMTVTELDEKNKEGIVVHGYQRAGVGVKEHIKYLAYLLKNFNIVMIVSDNNGADQFFSACNASDTFVKLGLKLEYFNLDTNAEGEEYAERLKEARNDYNVEGKKIVYKFMFTAPHIYRANERLQISFNTKKIKFASKLSYHEDIMNSLENLNLPLDLIYPEGISEKIDNPAEKSKLGLLDFVGWQEHIIQDTKDQCALIEPKNRDGTFRFDLPPHLKKINSNNKPRKDNYTTLFMANWTVKVYFEMMEQQVNTGWDWNKAMPTMF